MSGSLRIVVVAPELDLVEEGEAAWSRRVLVRALRIGLLENGYNLVAAAGRPLPDRAAGTAAP